MGTLLAVRRAGKTAVVADGLAAIGNRTVDTKARRVHRLAGGTALLGCAAPSALVGFLSREVEHWMETGSELASVAAAVATDWSEETRFGSGGEWAILATAGGVFVISARGEVFEPEDGIAAIGPGADLATGAALALAAHTKMSAEEIAHGALKLASQASYLVSGELAAEVI